MAPTVSGKAFLGLIRHVKQTRGEDALRAAVVTGGPSVEAVFEHPIGVMSWQPYHAYIAFLRALDRTLGRGDLAMCRDLGEMAGRRDVSTIFKIYVSLASPERLIRSCAKIWPSYYRDAGRMEALSWAPERTVLQIHEFREMDPAHCRLMEGWMIATMASIGCRVGDDAQETRCTSRGGSVHEFTCTWSRTRTTSDRPRLPG